MLKRFIAQVKPAPPSRLPDLEAREVHAGLEIHERYDRLVPPAAFRSTVEELLSKVPKDRLSGLGWVCLRDSGDVTGRGRRARRRRANKWICGTYHAASRTGPAHIDLFVDRITAYWSGWFFRMPPLREYAVSEVLYHELGHHIHATTAPERGSSEAIANAWARRLQRRFFRGKYGGRRLLRAGVLLALWAARLVQRIGRRIS